MPGWSCRRLSLGAGLDIFGSPAGWATTTLTTYAHMWPTAEDKTRKAASGMISAVFERSARNVTRDGVRGV